LREHNLAIVVKSKGGHRRGHTLAAVCLFDTGNARNVAKWLKIAATKKDCLLVFGKKVYIKKMALSPQESFGFTAAFQGSPAEAKKAGEGYCRTDVKRVRNNGFPMFFSEEFGFFLPQHHNSLRIHGMEVI
jgi:hypothetical protein